MLLDFKHLVRKYQMKFDNVTAVGAHWGEEYEDYILAGAKHITMIEPCAKAFDVLRSKFGNNDNVRLYNCACGDTRGFATMYTGDNTINHGQSNSLLAPALHLQLHKEVEFPDVEEVSIAFLDDMLEEGKEPKLLVMDCQGYEGHVIRGAAETLKTVQYIYTEVNKKEVYRGNTHIDELKELLPDFEIVEIGSWVGDAWTDCLFKRKSHGN